jgi:RNA-directed DNA polymerase
MKTLGQLNLAELDLDVVPKLDLFSIRDLESRLGYPREYLRDLAAKAGGHYDPFIKPNKFRWFQRVFKPPKKRIIDNPDTELRAVQRRIYRRLLRRNILPFYACGGIQGKSLLDNFSIHCGAKVLVTIDIANFFPSVTNCQVYFLWREVLNCSPEIAGLLTQLTTFERHLPQGAATSTPLANILICAIYKRVRSECERLGVKFSTWVDDLAFSGANARQVISVVIRTLHRTGLKVSRRKIRIMGSGSQKILNGIIVGRYPGLLRENLARIRSGIYKLKVGAVGRSDHSNYLRSLCARIGQAETINPKQVFRLRKKLIEILQDGIVSKKLKQKYLKRLQHSASPLPDKDISTVSLVCAEETVPPSCSPSAQ